MTACWREPPPAARAMSTAARMLKWDRNTSTMDSPEPDTNHTIDDPTSSVQHDHVASVTTKFCLDEHIDSVDNCYKLYQELVKLVFQLDDSKARPAYLPPKERTATLTLPVLTRAHPSNQRVYFDVEGLPTGKKDTPYCFFLDFDFVLATNVLAPVIRIIFNK